MGKKKKKSRSLENSENAEIAAAYAEQAALYAQAQARLAAQRAATIAAEQQQASLAAAAVAAATQHSASKKTFGAFGTTISFQVNDPYNDAGARQIAVPSQIQREIRGRWTSYNLIGAKPKKSFEGPDAANVTLSVTLDSDQGINPRATLARIREAIENGTVDYLVIGGSIVGNGSRYYIESMSETWERFFQGGRVTRATGEIVFSEYR